MKESTKKLVTMVGVSLVAHAAFVGLLMAYMLAKHKKESAGSAGPIDPGATSG